MSTGFDADAFSIAILRALAEAPGEGGMSLPRLGKRLGQARAWSCASSR